MNFVAVAIVFTIVFTIVLSFFPHSLVQIKYSDWLKLLKSLFLSNDFKFSQKLWIFSVWKEQLVNNSFIVQPSISCTVGKSSD